MYQIRLIGHVQPLKLVLHRSVEWGNITQDIRLVCVEICLFTVLVQEAKIAHLLIPPQKWSSKYLICKFQTSINQSNRYIKKNGYDFELFSRFRSRNARQCLPLDNNSTDNKVTSNPIDGRSARGLSPRDNNSQSVHANQQYNSTQIQLPNQTQQVNSHTPNAGSGIVPGTVHRMPSPAASMRVPPLMSAVSPMTAPVAQVAPVPRGFDHSQNQNMSQVCR